MVRVSSPARKLVPFPVSARRSRPTGALAAKALPLVLCLALGGATGCYSYRPATFDPVRAPGDIKGEVVRLRQGPFVQEMKVKRVEGPYVTGEIKDGEGKPVTVTMDLRNTNELEIRELSKGTKAGVITAGVLVGVGAVAGAIAGVAAGMSGSFRLSYAP